MYTSIDDSCCILKTATTHSAIANQKHTHYTKIGNIFIFMPRQRNETLKLVSLSLLLF